jgi:hypothetical protein
MQTYFSLNRKLQSGRRRDRKPQQEADPGGVVQAAARPHVQGRLAVGQGRRVGRQEVAHCQHPGAYPTKSYKYWFTNVCNTVDILVTFYRYFMAGQVFAIILSQLF